MNKVIVRIEGGIGNQLFCYAAARRLALVNNAELVIDDVTGFARDRRYRREYALDHFNIPSRKATLAERLEPFERYRRGMMKWVSNRKPFAERRYMEQEGLAFDERLLSLQVKGTIYLDGYWQSEDYFKDVEKTIREDLQIISPGDEFNQHMAEEIHECNAVAVHVRFFDGLESTPVHNVSIDYYQRAIELLKSKIDSPHYFLFSDNPDAARASLALPEGRVTFVFHNHGDENAYADLWLMTQCRHFIIANSTFSWWGAWLGQKMNSLVVAPDPDSFDPGNFWAIRGLVPTRWTRLKIY